MLLSLVSDCICVNKHPVLDIFSTTRAL